MKRETTEYNLGTNIRSDCLIIMPIYNRRHFLEQAFKALKEQTYRNWNLVIVDDGSSDHPEEMLKSLCSALEQCVTLVRQPNGGAGAARATGQAFLSDQRFVAFFDSDDIWHPDYLSTMLSLLEINSDVDWIFCACRRVDFYTGKTLQNSTFNRENDLTPLGFKLLPQESRGKLKVFKDNRSLARVQIDEPINAGFQNSVIRKELSKAITIPSLRVGEDHAFLLLNILNDVKIGFIDHIHVTYFVHSENLSNTDVRKFDIGKQVSVQEGHCKALLYVAERSCDSDLNKLIYRKVSSHRYWIIGYSFYWQNGEAFNALKIMIKEINEYPLNYKYWKTFLGCLVRAAKNLIFVGSGPYR